MPPPTFDAGGNGPGPCRAADLIEHAVEHAPPLLVLVEALIQEVPEEAPALRDAPADGEPDAARRVRVARVVLDEAHEIAGPRQPEADDARVGGAVDDVV